MFKIYFRVNYSSYVQYGTETYSDFDKAWEKATSLNEITGTNNYFVM